MLYNTFEKCVKKGNLKKQRKHTMTKMLKIFIDESGEFGFEQGSSELYVVSMVFYDTTINIDNFLHDFEDRLKRLGYSGMIHMADLVMNRGEYRN